MSDELEAQGVNSNSIIGLSKVVVEYMENDKDVIVTPNTPLPVTGTLTTDPDTPLDVVIVNPSIPEGDPLPVFQPISQGAFGDQIVANLSQEIALMFNYGVDSDVLNTLTQNSASVSASNSRMLISTGTTANSLAVVKSKDFLRYRPGYGGLARFTLGVTTGITGTEQTAGVGNEEDGLFFSYRDYDDSGIPDMCIVRRYFGAREIRYLTITTGSNAANNVTITLDGTAFVVAVSNNSGAANQTATNIATNFSSTNWTASAHGNIVAFSAVYAGTKSNSFSFSAGLTGVVATLTQKVAGVAFNEEVIPRSSWNYDKADGTGRLPLIDWAKGNIFQIKYQWLGYGMIQFYIEDPTLGRFIRVHAIEYANSNTLPTVGNPTFPFYFHADNGSTTSNIAMFTASCGGFIEGSTSRTTGGNTKTYTVADSCGSSGTLLGTLFNPNNYKNKNSRVQVSALDISASAADAVTFRFYKNSALTGNASWVAVGTNSAMYYDESSASYSGGDLSCAIRAEHQTNNTLSAADISGGILTIHPGEILSIVATSDVGTVKVGCSINWVEYL